MKSKLAILALVMVCLCGRAKADSTATAEASIDWAGITFSSPVSPGPLAHNMFSTFVEGIGQVVYPAFDPLTFQGQTASDSGWAPTMVTEHFSTGNVSTASTSATTVDAIATNTIGVVGTAM